MQFKQISISILIDKKSFEEIYTAQNILKNELGIQFQMNNQVCPHVNLFSGKVKKIDFLLDIKKIEFPKKIVLKSCGLALFLKKSPVLFVRYENCKYFSLIRKELSRLDFWVEKDKFAKKKFWLPKTTIALKDLKYNHLSKTIKTLSEINFEKTIYCNSLLIIEYHDGKKEKLLNILKLN